MLEFFSSLFTTPRGRITLGLFIVTGLASVIIGVIYAGAAWVAGTQTILVLVFVLGTVLIYAPREQYPRVLAIAAPALGAVILGLTVLSQYFLVTVGAAAGWIVAGLFLFRQQTPREVMQAIREMRKGNYDAALENINEMIKRDKTNPEHYRLRAMILRLDEHLGRSRRDYETMLSYIPEGDTGDTLRAEAYDGLAEVHLQAGRYEDADEAAQKAHNLFPDNWVPLYNLGLINDRLKRPQLTIDYLNRALEIGIPDQRQRLLAYLYLARAHARAGDTAAAKSHVDDMMHLWKGLEGLQKLLSDEQSAPLAAVLADDVETARALMIEEMSAGDLT